MIAPRMIELPKKQDPRGNLTAIEGDETAPFSIRRVYYLYDVPGGETRGGHAHKELEQLIIAVSGSFDVTLDNGSASETFTLNRPFEGLLVPKMHWRELTNFSSGSVCLVLASQHYDESDYYREYADFRAAVEARA